MFPSDRRALAEDELVNVDMVVLSEEPGTVSRAKLLSFRKVPMD